MYCFDALLTSILTVPYLQNFRISYLPTQEEPLLKLTFSHVRQLRADIGIDPSSHPGQEGKTSSRLRQTS
jgi:hypothetical protein